MPGDLVYFVLPVADGERAKAFYGDVLGWEFSPGSVPGGHNIVNTTPHGGLFGGGTGSSPSVYFQVDDIEAAIAKVRERGGEAGEAEQSQAGTYAACRDDQGTEFNLFQP
jgi:predicted enzyme related to lactoylglutathione lyase